MSLSFQNVLDARVLLINSEKQIEKNCIFRNQTSIYIVIVIVTLIASIVLIVYVALGGFNDAIG